MRLVLEVHRLGGTVAPVRLSEVARVTGISRRFLEQLALALKRHGLLGAVPGRRGGYYLARPAEQISIGDVITAAAGPISLAICVEYSDICMHAEYCECRLVWSLLQSRVDAVLAEHNIAELSSETALQAIRKEIDIADAVCRGRKRQHAHSHEMDPCAPACARFSEHKGVLSRARLPDPDGPSESQAQRLTTKR